MPALADEAGAKLMGILEMLAREMLRSKLRDSQQMREMSKKAAAAAKDLSNAGAGTLGTGTKFEMKLKDLESLKDGKGILKINTKSVAKPQEFTTTFYSSPVGAQTALKELKKLSPNLFENATVVGNYLVHPAGRDHEERKSMKHVIAMINHDHSLVGIALEADKLDKQIGKGIFECKKLDDGTHIVFGSNDSNKNVLNAAYYGSILDEFHIGSKRDKNEIVINPNDYDRTMKVFKNAQDKLELLDEKDADQIQLERYQELADMLGIPNPDLADMLGISNPDLETASMETEAIEANILEAHRDGEQGLKPVDPEKTLDQARDEVVAAEGAVEDAQTKFNALQSAVEIAKGDEGFNKNALAVLQNKCDAVKADLDDAQKALEEKRAALAEVEKGVDPKQETSDQSRPASEQKTQYTEKAGPEQTVEIEEEELAAKTVEQAGIKDAKAHDADGELARETRKAELHEDIANVKTTADCVQARPDANSQDISTPYADGQDAPGTGDIDSDGVPDSAEDRDGDGTPDSRDADAEIIDDDPDYEPISMETRNLDTLMEDKISESNFENARSAEAASKDISLETVSR